MNRFTALLIGIGLLSEASPAGSSVTQTQRYTDPSLGFAPQHLTNRTGA